MKPAAKSSADRAKVKALLSALRPIVRHHLPLLRRSADLHADFCTFFRECLTPWLNYYMAIDGLLTDALDLETVVFCGVPGVLCGWLCEVLNGRIAARIVPDYTRRHLTRGLRLLSERLDPHGSAGMDPRTDSQDMIDPHRVIVAVAIRLEDEISDFGARVFFADPQPEPVTDAQRKAARRRRLDNYVRVAKLQGITMSFSEVCRRADVDRTGRRSGKDWLNGKLPDEAKVSRAIEDVIDFRSK